MHCTVHMATATAPKEKESTSLDQHQATEETLEPVHQDPDEGIVPDLQINTQVEDLNSHEATSQAPATVEPQENNRTPETESVENDHINVTGSLSSSVTETAGQPIQVEPGGPESQDTETSNPWSQTPVVKVITEDANLLRRLSHHLDRPHRAIKSHEHLACALDVPADIRAKCKLNTEHSPTEKLFDLLEAYRADLTVPSLITKLQKIGRNDVVGIIKQHIPDAEALPHMTVCDAVNEKPELVDAIAAKLDEKTRFNNNWFHLGRSFGLPKKQLVDIECGTNSTLILMEYTYNSPKSDMTLGEFEGMMTKFQRNDVLKVLEPVLSEDRRQQKMSDIIPLESECMANICRSLNKPVPGLKNWKNVASELNVPRVIYKDFNPKQLESPTKVLFEWLSKIRPGLTAGELCAALDKIGRKDAVLMLQEEVQPSQLNSTNGQV